jgi:hypothetical protein
LDKGELYLLKASGIAGTGDLQQDAEYGQFAAGGRDSVGGVNVGVDVGIPEGRPTKYVPAGRTKWFGGYRADHVYRMIVTGTGAPLSIKLIRPAGADGSGAIRVSLLRLSPAPTLPAAIDSIKVPYIKQTVHSAITGEKGKVYLMQASGSGKVGGANLGLGDAEWMDWAADGAGKVDIGDGNVDYGLAVDESDPSKTPHRYWWGPWRKDHVYYLLYLGTGAPIGFTYYDVGDYGDNTRTDKMTVRVYPVP